MNQEYLEVQSIPAPVLVAQAVPAVKRARGRECRVCLGEHDEETHSATLAVRAWYRSEVTKYLDDVPIAVCSPASKDSNSTGSPDSVDHWPVA
jgi:hypothetical protein